MILIKSTIKMVGEGAGVKEKSKKRKKSKESTEQVKR